MNPYLSLLHNELNPADNDIDECFAIGFTGNLNMPDGWLKREYSDIDHFWSVTVKWLYQCLWSMLPIYVTENYFRNAGVY